MPRVPSPYGDEIFYYAQADMVKETAKGKSWKWCEVRPDVIIGTLLPKEHLTAQRTKYGLLRIRTQH